MFSHVVVGSNDLARSKVFYDAVLAVVGAAPGEYDAKGRIVYSHGGSRLLVTTPVDGEPDVEADVHAAVAKMEEDIEHPEENEAEAEADTTITRMEEDQDPVAEEQRGAVEGWDMSGVVTPALRSSPGPTKTPPLPEMEERSQGMLETEAAERALQGDIEMHDQT